ncbi:MAG: ribonuclease Y [Propionibacteriaceae bacterium]|jgi:ribonuclease Y|nr:ribonuclease Y [Propionibacteriaceae bacterium]
MDFSTWDLVTWLTIMTVVVVVVLAAVIVMLLSRLRRADYGPMRELNRREEQLDRLEKQLARQAKALHDKQQELDEAEAERLNELGRIGELTPEDARAELIARIEHDARLRGAQLAREIELNARRDAEDKAREIVVGAIQRLASQATVESSVAVVALPGEEMKGRIIGREGRNIRAFEQVTGVNVMIDDTPGSVLLSSFDPVRRETARATLEDLVADGRIHPARIEEAYVRAKRKTDEAALRAAEDALLAVGITDLPQGLLPVVGALHYRTSYGQNVLAHSVESAELAGLMATELGLNAETCRRAAFLHDIGKAMTHEAEGSHARVGAELARRYGEHPDVVHAIEAHHDEVEPRTVEALLTQAADAISGSRPGARRESLEAYVKRLERLEQLASALPGVDKVFAMQAGREVRVMVQPDVVSDAEAAAIANDIAHRIQTELTYPGSIKVVVVRESRATALAR